MPRSIRKRSQAVLAYARQIAPRVTSWADFSNAMFSQVTGRVARTFPDMEERQRFFDTREYREIQVMLEKLMDHFGLLEGATPESHKKPAKRPTGNISTPVEVIEIRNAGFDPNQPRDDIGRWSATGGGVAEKPKKSRHRKKKPPFGAEKPQFNSIAEAEAPDSPMWTNDYETAVIELKDGTVVEVGGQRARIDIREENVPKLKDAIFTHNHPPTGVGDDAGPTKLPYPGGSHFSPEDIWASATSDLKEVRAFGEDFNGDRWVSSFKRPSEGWQLDKIANMLNEYVAREYEELVPLTATQEIEFVPHKHRWKGLWDIRERVWNSVIKRQGLSQYYEHKKL